MGEQGMRCGLGHAEPECDFIRVLDTLANHGREYALQVLMSKYFAYWLSCGATGLTIIDRRRMPCSHLSPRAFTRRQLASAAFAR